MTQDIGRNSSCRVSQRTKKVIFKKETAIYTLIRTCFDPLCILWDTFLPLQRPIFSCGVVQFLDEMVLEVSYDTSLHRRVSVTTVPLIGSTMDRSRALKLRKPDPNKIDTEREVFQNRPTEEVRVLTQLLGHTAGELTVRTPPEFWDGKSVFCGGERGDRSDAVRSKPGARCLRVRDPMATGCCDAAGMRVGLCHFPLRVDVICVHVCHPHSTITSSWAGTSLFWSCLLAVSVTPEQRGREGEQVTPYPWTATYSRNGLQTRDAQLHLVWALPVFSSLRNVPAPSPDTLI